MDSLDLELRIIGDYVAQARIRMDQLAERGKVEARPLANSLLEVEKGISGWVRSLDEPQSEKSGVRTAAILTPFIKARL